MGEWHTAMATAVSNGLYAEHRHAPVSAARAEGPASRMLSSTGPWATMGHLLHMPSHTYVRIGRWHDAVVSNIRCGGCCRMQCRAAWHAALQLGVGDGRHPPPEWKFQPQH